MSGPIVLFNEDTLKDDLRELVRITVQDTLNGLLEEEADDLIGAERYERTAGREAYRAGHYDRKLTMTRARPPSRCPSPRECASRGRHRALPQARDQRRGGDDRDVPGRRRCQEDRGRLRDPLGLERLGVHGIQPQREGLRGNRGMEEQAARARLPLRLHRRHLFEAQLDEWPCRMRASCCSKCARILTAPLHLQEKSPSSVASLRIVGMIFFSIR